MAASVTDTQGIIAIAAGAVAVVALLGCVLLAIQLRRVRQAQRLLIGATGEQDVIAHAASMQEAFESLREYVEETAVRLDGRLASAEARAARRRSRTARWCATTPTTSSPGTSRCRSRCSTTNARGSCSRASTTATRRACTASGCTSGRGELELSPEEAEAVRLALTGAAAGARASGRCREPTDGGRAARRLPRTGRHVQRGGAAHERAPGQRRARGRREHPGGGRRAARRRGRARARADRELARGLDQRHARPARRAGRSRADRGRDAAGRAPLPDRRAGGRAGGDRDGRLAPAGARAVHALPAHASCRGRSIRAAASTAEAVRGVVAADDGATRRARHRARRRDLRRRACCARGSRTATTTRRASCGSPAAARPQTSRRRGDGGDGGEPAHARSSSGARARATPAGSCAASTSSPPARSTCTRSSRARGASSSATTCSSSSSRGDERDERGGGRARRAARPLRTGAACSAPTARLPGSATARRERPPAALLSGCRAGGVRRCRRACARYTAAGSWRAQSHQSRWGPCRPLSTSGTDLSPRRARRWVAGCSF